MEIFIRNIVPEDAEDIARLTAQLGYSLSVTETAQNIKAIREHKDHDAFVAIYEQHIVGWIGVFNAIQLESLPFCEIRGLVVDDQYRKMGIGNLLIEKAKQWCQDKGNKLLRLRCNVKRTETHLFYLHLGFVEKKEQKVFEIGLID